MNIDGMDVKEYFDSVIRPTLYMMPALFLMCNRLKYTRASHDLTHKILDTMPEKFLMGKYFTVASTGQCLKRASKCKSALRCKGSMQSLGIRRASMPLRSYLKPC